jgi:hypothetical protein
MIDNKYIVLFYYDYDHKTDIIENDKKIQSVINLSIYESVSKFFSQLDSRRYFCIVISTPFIYKLIKVVKYPLKIDTIFKILPDLNESLLSSLTDSQGFIKAPFDSVTEEDYQLSKYEDYFMEDIKYVENIENVKLQKGDILVRIYGRYTNTIPLNFLMFEDLSINISLKCR